MFHNTQQVQDLSCAVYIYQWKLRSQSKISYRKPKDISKTNNIHLKKEKSQDAHSIFFL